MKRIYWIAIIAVWVLFCGMLLFAYISAPPKDQYMSLKTYVEVARNYLDKRPIKPDEIDISDDNFQFVKYLADYFRVYQVVEKDYNSIRRRVKVVVEAQNLAVPESIERGLVKIDEYDKIAANTNAEIEKASAEVIKNTNAVPYEKTFFNSDDLAAAVNKKADLRREIGEYRVLLGQYFRAILEFVSSREGYYHVNGTRVVFDDPVDQKYYNQLLADVKTFENKIDAIMNAEKSELRTSLQKIKL